MSDENKVDSIPEGPENEAHEPARHQTSRGEFLKWGTVALSGIYVGPKITSFAVEKSLGHSGSVGPSPSPYPTPSPYIRSPTFRRPVVPRI